MRIVAGQWRGRTIAAPSEGDQSIRPTSDRAREALFNILFSNYGLPEGVRVLDLCCGTGALGFEALSRGAAHCTFIDNTATALRLVKETAQKFNAIAQTTIHLVDAGNMPPATATFDLVFCDPPYRQNIIPAALTQLVAKNYLTPETLLVLEVASDELFDVPAGFDAVDTRRYGVASLYFVRKSGAAERT